MVVSIASRFLVDGHGEPFLEVQVHGEWPQARIARIQDLPLEGVEPGADQIELLHDETNGTNDSQRPMGCN